MASDAVNIKELFLALADLPSNERADRLAEVEPATRLRVEALLRSHDEAGSESPAPDGPRTDAYMAKVQDASYSEQAGQHVGPYKLLEKLGEGGMGTVWAAEQLEPIKRRVALKLIKAGMDSTKVLRRFEAERQALAMMDHANIAKVLDAGQIPPVAPGGLAGRPFFVMELIHGINITKYCDQEHLTPQERLELFVPICQAVQHAHQKGIIHRDLKPSNVLVGLYDGRPVPKVIDFGVAKATQQALTEGTIHTEVGQIVGTLEYMSPEQAELNNLDIDTRSDIYSLGVILYELLAGTPPFTRKQLQSGAFSEMLRVIREVEPQKPSTRLSSSDELPSIAANRHLDPKRLTKTISGDLDWIVMKCLEKERGRRYETANALASDIQRHLADEPVLAGPPSATYRLRKFVRRNRGAVIAAGLVAASLVAGMAGTAWQAHSARLARIDAEKQTQQARDEKQIAFEERKKAEQENAIAQAISDFLRKDLLEQADIGNQPGEGGRNKDITVRELVARAAKKLDGRFVGQELTEAAIRLTISNVYREWNQLDEAQLQLERALKLRQDKLGRAHQETLICLNNLASIYHRRSWYDKAEPLYREVLAARTANLGPDHVQTLNCTNNLAILLHDLGRYDEAEVMYRRVLERRQATLGPENAQTINSFNNLAFHLNYKGRAADALPLMEQALKSYRKIHGSDHPITLSTINNLALVYHDLDRLEEAVALHKEALETRRAKLGPTDARTCDSMVNLGLVYNDIERFNEAEQLIREAIATREKAGGPDHPATLSSRHCLALIRATRGERDDAVAIYQEVLAGRRARLPPDHFDTLKTSLQLGVVYVELGRFADAEPLLRNVLAAHRAKKRNESDLLATLEVLARCIQSQDRAAEAEPMIREVLAADEAKSPQAWYTAHSQMLLGECLLRQKHLDDAATWLSRGLSTWKQADLSKKVRPRLHKMRDLVQRVVTLYEATAKPDEAAKWQKELEELKAVDTKP